MSAARRCGIAVISVVAMTLLATPAATAEQGIGHYVALGDSFTAGPFIPLQHGDPIGCARSTRNYPSMVAAGLDVEEFTDVSCSAAVTEDMTQPQTVPLGVNPPQFGALRADTDLVTVGIVGNDIGFSDILTTCAQLSVTDPHGDPCREHATAGGGDIYAERIDAAAPELAEVLQGIAARSPDATVVLVGYLRILPPADGCFPLVPIARGDVPYLDGLQRQLTEMMAGQAAEHGALFDDPYAISLGRDVCAGPLRKWVEGFIPSRPAFPVHPNASGMQAVADLVLETLTGD
ncbi:MAG: SGNH/GDSL hydrolase family protein [Pseudonocardiaceae bacterium]|nr:SGNH/GDSL hydrolase family protein [Pseudonocardiaceae bacterium]